MTAPAPAPPLTAARPPIPPPTTAGATWAISHPHCWTPPPPQTLPSSQRRTLQECTSETTFVLFVFLITLSNPFLSTVDFKSRYSITKSCMHILRIFFLLFFWNLHTLYQRICLNQLCFTFLLTKFLFLIHKHNGFYLALIMWALVHTTTCTLRYLWKLEGWGFLFISVAYCALSSFMCSAASCPEGGSVNLAVMYTDAVMLALGL